MSIINSPVTVTIKSAAGMDSLYVSVEIADAAYDAGEIFDSIPLSVASCHCECYTADHISASCNGIKIPVEIIQDIGMFGPQNTYRFAEAVSGSLRVCYDFDVPRHDPYARNPGFSAAAHDHGITVAGITFLLLPSGINDFKIKYDFSELAGAASAAAGCHRGDFELTGSCRSIKYIYYAMGNLTEYHSPGSKLHIYTMDDDERLFSELAETAGIYFDYMADFFHDDVRDYSFFLYPSRRTELTGTALERCCYLGLGNDRIESINEVENILAHELTHNWCSLADDEAVELHSLFAEATAEYYSGYMQYHTGQADLDRYVSEINKKLKDYYINPHAACAYKDTYDKSWTHAFAQKAPYFKGLTLLLRIDYAIRTSTDGSRSLDDVILRIIDETKNGSKWYYNDFISAVDELTDGKGSEISESVMGEGLQTPPSDFFGSDYELVEETAPVACEGFDLTVNFTDKIIRGLIPGSNAEKAGLKNGDQIIRMSTFDASGKSPTDITVLREGIELSFSYYPFGHDVQCWQYRRKTNI